MRTREDEHKFNNKFASLFFDACLYLTSKPHHDFKRYKQMNVRINTLKNILRELNKIESSRYLSREMDNLIHSLKKTVDYIVFDKNFKKNVQKADEMHIKLEQAKINAETHYRDIEEIKKNIGSSKHKACALLEKHTKAFYDQSNEHYFYTNIKELHECLKIFILNTPTPPPWLLTELAFNFLTAHELQNEQKAIDQIRECYYQLKCKNDKPTRAQKSATDFIEQVLLRYFMSSNLLINDVWNTFIKRSAKKGDKIKVVASISHSFSLFSAKPPRLAQNESHYLLDPYQLALQDDTFRKLIKSLKSKCQFTILLESREGLRVKMK